MGRESSGAGAKSGAKVPRINNPAGIPSNAITEQEFLALRGVGDISSGYTVDKLRGNRELKTQRGQDRFNKAVEKAENEYQQKRQDARKEYSELVQKGKIRDKTTVEKELTSAHGNPNNQSTQAARRMLKLRGIDWRTGKKLS